MSENAFTYQPKKNEDGRHFAGVPLRTLTVAESRRLTWAQLQAVNDSKFYSTTKAGRSLLEEMKPKEDTQVVDVTVEIAAQVDAEAEPGD